MKETNNVVEFRLLDCEVDIILEALIAYNYNINKKYNFRKVSLTQDETTEKYMVRTTYEHVLYCRKSKLKKAN